MKYLAIASAFAVIAFGAAGSAWAMPDISAARESGAAASLVKIFNDPTPYAVRNVAHRPLYARVGHGGVAHR